MRRLAQFGVLVLAPLTMLGCQQPAATTDTQDFSDRLAGLSPEIRAADCRAHVSYIASDECDGRLTGTPGALRAAKYIAAAFRQAGLRSLAADDSFLQPFEFTSGVRAAPSGNALEILPGGETAGAAQPCKLDDDYRPLAFSADGAAEGAVVFAGYGIVEPQATGKGYDSYAGLEVKDKIVLVLRHMPEDLTPQRRQELSMYSGDRYKTKIAADRGAKGVLLVTGPNSPNPGQVVKLRDDDRTSAGLIPAVSISGELAERLLKQGGLEDLKAMQTAHDAEAFNPHLQRALAGVRVRLSVTLERLKKTCQNVVGVLPPSGGATQYVMIGAHYDHIGHGIGLGSMARQGEEGQIHNGADDNASGDSAVLELAAALADARARAAGEVQTVEKYGFTCVDLTTGNAGAPQRGVIFACWSGEELGIIGSAYFAAHPPVPLDNIVAYLNFDMVGRLREDKLILQAVGSSATWPDLIKSCNEAGGFDLAIQEDPYLPTDTTAFYPKGMPVLAFFTGVHDDYNRPTDDSETLNYEGVQRIASFAKCLVDQVVRPDVKVEYKRVEAAPSKGTGGGMRAYTGTVPDYVGGDVKGAKLADVRPGGPAEKAGLKAGDVIIEFAGRKVAGLQDYADALAAAKIGQPVEVVVEREGQRLSLTITPTPRPE